MNATKVEKINEMVYDDSKSKDFCNGKSAAKLLKDRPPLRMKVHRLSLKWEYTRKSGNGGVLNLKGMDEI